MRCGHELGDVDPALSVALEVGTHRPGFELRGLS
jgi:hypothetical protein